jgi:hypothetical protein
VVRSHVGEPVQFHLGVAQWAAHLLWEHGVAGSRPAAETNHQRALGRGRSSMAELRDVTPPVPVRLRPVIPKRMCNPIIPSWRNRDTRRSQKPEPAGHVRSTRTEGTNSCVANSSGRVPGS